MELKCKKEAIAEDGHKTLNFTKGRMYYFEESTSDGEEIEWLVLDDNGKEEIFFDTSIMFE